MTVIDFQPGDFRTSFNAVMKRDPALGEGNPQVTAAWDAAMERAAEHHRLLIDSVGRNAAQYAVPLAFRIRFFMPD